MTPVEILYHVDSPSWIPNHVVEKGTWSELTSLTSRPVFQAFHVASLEVFIHLEGEPDLVFGLEDHELFRRAGTEEAVSVIEIEVGCRDVQTRVLVVDKQAPEGCLILARHLIGH